MSNARKAFANLVAIKADEIVKLRELRKNVGGHLRRGRIRGGYDNKKLRKYVFKSYPNTILGILNDNKNYCLDSSVFGAAMKRCNELKEYTYCKHIMDMMLVDGMTGYLDVVKFNIFFDGMCSMYNGIRICKEYYGKMEEYGLIPDSITFSTLVKGCVYHGKRMSGYAEYLFYDEMIGKYNLKPSIAIYTLMLKIYGKTGDIEKAQHLFNEYYLKLNDNVCDIAVWNALISCYANAGMIKEIKDTIKKMSTIGIVFDSNNSKYLCTMIMKTYLHLNNPNGIFNVYNKMITKDVKPDKLIIYHKYKGYYLLLQKDLKYYHLNKILTEMDSELTQYNIKSDHLIHSLKLESIILYYSTKDPLKIIQYYEDNSHNFPIFRTPNIMDFHEYSKILTQFILRYIFGFKIKDILSNDDLKIICGKNKNNENSLKQFILNEINSWNYNIIIENDPTNSGCIIIPKQNIIHFNGKTNDIIINFFENISNNWCCFEKKFPEKIDLQS